MEKVLNTFFLFLLIGLFSTHAQVITNFDSAVADTTFQVLDEGAPSAGILSDDNTDFKEGTGSLRAKIKIGNFHSWGSFVEIQHSVKDGDPLIDWSSSDTLKLWIKVIKAPTNPGGMFFRFQIQDQPAPDATKEMYIYENATILDAVTDWIELKIPLVEVPSDGSVNPGETGLTIAPSGWGLGKNNGKLDLDKIFSWSLVAVTDGAFDDSLEVMYDNLQRTGLKAVPAIIFNGIAVPSNLSVFTWGQSTLEVVDGAGATPKTNALKWTQGDEWSNGWSGAGWDISPAFNLAGGFAKDSLKFKMKTVAGVDTIRLQFEDGNAKVGYRFKPIDDEVWHNYSFPLKDFVPIDNTTGFDSSNVTVFQFMAEANSKAGNIIWLDDIWTGNPVFDVIPPDPATNVSAVASTPGINKITWNDVPNETGEVYNVYYSTSPITDVKASGVELGALKIAENTQEFLHVLKAPAKDQNVTYYYAVECVDAAGNVGVSAASTGSVTNLAKGTVVIYPAAPANFAADGNLSEWAGIKPIRMNPQDGSGFVVTNTKITDSTDLNVKAYVAMDDKNLYVAFDIEDDVVYFDAALSSYLNDAPDLFLGLYDYHGASHTSYKRGAQPDYHFRFAKDRALLDGLSGGDSLLVPGSNYFWGEKFPTGYTVEAIVPLAELAKRGKDSLFVPEVGMRIPIDFSINDNDGAQSNNDRQGILTLSQKNEDQSWNDVSRWTYTWYGDQWVVSVEDQNVNTVMNYRLDQNYPNPFNPATQISYTLEKPGIVTLKVYDILGRVVTTLVDANQTAGSHTITFNASNLASGIYFYKLETDSFTSVKKMMLLK